MLVSRWVVIQITVFLKEKYFNTEKDTHKRKPGGKTKEIGSKSQVQRCCAEPIHSSLRKGNCRHLDLRLNHRLLN